MQGNPVFHLHGLGLQVVALVIAGAEHGVGRIVRLCLPTKGDVVVEGLCGGASQVAERLSETEMREADKRRASSPQRAASGAGFPQDAKQARRFLCLALPATSHLCTLLMLRASWLAGAPAQPARSRRCRVYEGEK